MPLRSSLMLSAVLFALIIVLSAFDQVSSASIGKIVDKPRDYAGKQVSVSGEVTEVFSFLVVKYFSVRDNTREITVVRTEPLPKKGRGDQGARRP